MTRPLHRISASKIELAEYCPASCSLLTPTVDIQSDYADAGTDEHALIEACLGGTLPGREDWSVTFTRWHDEYWDRDNASGGPRSERMWFPEVAFAWDPATGDVMREPPREGERVHRDYAWVPPGWVPGSVDAYAIEIVGGEVILWVVDWKTGAALHVARASENLQLLILALCLIRIAEQAGYVVTCVGIEIVHANDRRVWVDEYMADREDIVDVEYRLANIVREAASPAPEVRAGGHCKAKFCSSYGLCSATAGALAVVAPEPDLGLPARAVVVDGSFEDNDHAAWQYMLLQAAEARIKAAKDALVQHVKARGHVRLPSGMWYGLQPRVTEEYDATVPGALEAVQRVLGEDWKTAATIKIPKSGVTNAARDISVRAKERGEKVTMKSIEQQVKAEMELCGAVKVKETLSLREFTPPTNDEIEALPSA